jgi:purine-binding chemotaxis protein CheW
MNTDTTIKTNQYLFFKLGDEVYAINAYNVQEVVDFKPITKVPNTHNYVKGITNIRGELIAVVDPQVRFGNEESKINKRTSFIIINVFDKMKNEKVLIALMVDFVLEVEYIEDENILESPEFGTKIEKRFIRNILKYKDNYISVLKISLVLDINELSKRG